MFNVSIFISGFTLLLRHPMESLPSVFDSQIRSVCVHIPERYMENQPQGFWLLWVSESCRDIIKKKSQNWFLSTTWECLVIKQNPFVTAKRRAGPCGILTLACGIGWSVCCSFYCSYAVFFYAAHGEGDEMTEISECEKTNVLRRAGYHQHSVTVFCQSSVEIDMCVCLCWSMCIREMMRYNLTCRKPEWTCFSHREEMTQPGGAPPLCLLSLLQPVCVCVFLIQRGCGCVSLQGFGLRLHVSSENECHMSLIWSFDLLYLLLNICVCSVVSFLGSWNIEGFLAQVECLSVRECVCARVGLHECMCDRQSVCLQVWVCVCLSM